MRIEELTEFRAEVLWWEFCALMHDIGKLSSKFLAYRQNWHRRHGEDPHTDEWFDKHEQLLGGYDSLSRFFREPIVQSRRPRSEISVIRAVHSHIAPAADDELTNLLKKGDGADSRYDRNNALAGTEQTDHYDPESALPIYRSNVFGYEGEDTLVTPNSLDADRERLYADLERILRPFFNSRGPETLSLGKYYKLRACLREHFEHAMSDTTRPNNDTSLWEHVYSVASLTKAMHIQKLLGREVGGTATFRIWSVGFDSLRYLSYSHRISDVLGRRRVLGRILDRTEHLVEYLYPFGNRVYRDNGTVVFLVPDMNLPDNLAECVCRSSVDLSGGELVPQFACIDQGVTSLTCIVAVIDRLRKQLETPVETNAGMLAERFRVNWVGEKGRGKSVCSICRIRPTLREEENRLVCRVCLQRRRHWTSGFTDADPGAPPPETPMLEEIADSHGRVALIVAKFSLEDWLDGRMVRTCLITEPHAIAKTAKALPAFGNVLDAANDGLREEFFRKRGEYDYGKIRDDVLRCYQQEAREDSAVFLYDRMFEWEPPRLRNSLTVIRASWDELLAQARREPGCEKLPDLDLLTNLLCAKTPTPSTLLDVWETTKEFLTKAVKVPQGLEPKARSWVKVDQMPGIAGFHHHESFDALAAGQRCTAVYEKPAERFWLVGLKEQFNDEWKGKTLKIVPENRAPRTGTIVDGSPKERACLPYRVILSSPDLLMVLVPAANALGITRELYRQYLVRFGKAYGRLPFSIGNIFFQKHLPIFSVLDAGRRMEESFRRLGRELWLEDCLPQMPPELKLGGGKEPDWHHPYVLAKDGSGYFETILGPVVHIPEAGDRVLRLRPNLYDCEFLGASADRFHLYTPTPRNAPTRGELSAELRRTGAWGGPFLMEDLQCGVEDLWKRLRELNVEDSSIRNLESLLASRRERWRGRPDGKPADPDWPNADEALIELANGLISKLFESEDDAEAVRRAVANGFLERTLNLYLRILKERLEADRHEHRLGQAVP